MLSHCICHLVLITLFYSLFLVPDQLSPGNRTLMIFTQVNIFIELNSRLWIGHVHMDFALLRGRHGI